MMLCTIWEISQTLPLEWECRVPRIKNHFPWVPWEYTKGELLQGTLQISLHLHPHTHFPFKVNASIVSRGSSSNVKAQWLNILKTRITESFIFKGNSWNLTPNQWSASPLTFGEDTSALLFSLYSLHCLQEFKPGMEAQIIILKSMNFKKLFFRI